MKTALKVALGIIIGLVVVVGGCTALLGAGINEADKEQKKKGITASQFRAIKHRTSRSEVQRKLGRPEDSQRFEDAGVRGVTRGSRSSCIYYPEKGKGIGEGRSFQFCFTNGQLDSKNAY